MKKITLIITAFILIFTCMNKVNSYHETINSFRTLNNVQTIENKTTVVQEDKANDKNSQILFIFIIISALLAGNIIGFIIYKQRKKIE